MEPRLNSRLYVLGNLFLFYGGSMSVNIKGLRKLDSNYFDEIVISQNGVDDYNVFVSGKNISVSNSNFSDMLKKLSSYEIICMIIRKFIEDITINEITDLVDLPHRDGKWLLIYGDECHKALKLQLFGSKFKPLFDEIKMKYFNDRYNYFWNSEIKTLKLSSNSFYSSYYGETVDCEKSLHSCVDEFNCDNYVKYVVKLDKNGKVMEFERKFIEEFLYHKFWSVGEEVKIKGIFEEYSYSLNRILKGHIIKSGDLEVIFPHNEDFMFMFSIVNNYNNELFKIKEDVKKKQLKMEGF